MHKRPVIVIIIIIIVVAEHIIRNIILIELNNSVQFA